MHGWAIFLAVVVLTWSSGTALALTAPSSRAITQRRLKVVLPKLAAPRTVTATSGNLTNVVRWSGVGSRRVARYAVYRAPSAAGPYVRVASVAATARSFTDPIASSALGVYHYKVAALERNGRASVLSRSAAADRVSITAVLDPLSATPIVASSGELVLDVPAGAVSEPTAITIFEREAPGVLNGVDRTYTGAYDFGPDGLVFNPAARPRLGLRYAQFGKEAFEEQWVSRTSNLYVYDETAFLWTVASQGISVDPAENTVFSDIGHFTEYSNTFSYMPHGRSSSTTNLCLVCHDLHTAADESLNKRERVEGCLYCHGADQASGNTTATLGPNIQAEAYMCSNQTTSGKSYHPVSERKVVCADCHTPHYDPNQYPKLLFYWAPDAPGSSNIVRWYNVIPGIGGTRRTALSPNSGQGNKNCLGCHGPFRNTAVIATGTGAPENPSDNYWLRTGGDHSTDMSGSAGFYASGSHGSVDNTYSPPRSSYGATSSIDSTSTQVQCLKCHNEHGRDASAGQDSLASLLKPSINGTTVTGNDKTLCYACHSLETSGYPTSAYSANKPSHDVSGYPDRIAADGSRGGGGTWPGRATFENTSQVSSHIGDPHGTTNTVWPSSGLKGGECANCHAVHTTQTALYYDFLKARYSTGKGAETNAQAFALCFTCHGASGNPTGAANIVQFYGAGDGHKISTAASLTAGDGLPCYECHQPHGSKSGNRWAISDERWSNIDPGISADGTAAAQDRNNNGVNDARDFCFGCHLAFDDATATAGKVVGIDRQLVASKLKITNKPEHLTTNKTKNCKACHIGPHDPSGGISLGGVACYGCHAALQPMEDAAGTTTGGATGLTAYHHVLGQSGGSEGDTAPAASTYPTSTANLFCVSCHVDHNYFNDGTLVTRGSNLRANIATSAATTASTDYIYDATKNYGICESCHRISQTKDITAQKDDGYSVTTARIGATAYNSSSHQYSVGTSFGPAASDRFDANCSKCHNDSQTKTYAASTYKFGPHVAAERRILEAFGVPIRDPLREDDCFGCHSEASDVTSGTSKPVAGRDGYGMLGVSMDATTQKTYKVFHLNPQSVHGTGQAGIGYVTCANCHNPHTSSDATKVADPYNVYNRASYDTTASRTAFCLSCHKFNDFFNPPPTYVSNDTTWVPVTVQVNGGWQWDMATNGARGHWSANGSIGSTETIPCTTCHDKHGSSVDSLLGVYDVATGANKVNGTTVTANDEDLCFACHTNASTYYPNFSRTTSGYPNHGTWPGKTVWQAASPHGANCTWCHNVHGNGPGTYDGLGVFGPTTFGACMGCHSSSFPAWGDIRRYYPVSAGGTNTGPRAGHSTLSTGTLPPGSAVPCYDCHNPHGSAETTHALMVVTQAAGTTFTVGDTSGEITMSAARTNADVRRFCFTCHTTGDAGLTYGWNGTTLTAVAAPARVEGIDRTVYSATGEHLKLPPVGGHNYNDAQSCYQCHGESYADANSNNVHNPSPGVSSGGTTCYTCHSTYRNYMEDQAGTQKGSALSTSTYHHVLGGAAPYSEGDTATADGTGAYPTSKTDVYCISCHSDHNYFNGRKAKNLRADIANASGADTRAADFVSADATGGVCTSCHGTSALAKDTTNQKYVSGDNTQTQVVSATVFNASAHDYLVTSTFTADSSTFYADCSKCHGDNLTKSYQSSPMPRQFGTHAAPVRALLAQLGLGAAYTDPLEEKVCYECHTGAGDYYSTMTTMSAAAKAIEDSFTVAFASKHPVDAGTQRVECDSCHNVHVSSAATKVIDPDNTLRGFSMATTSTKTDFCGKCHDGVLPSMVSNNTTYVPYTVTVSNPTTANVMDDWTYSGHGSSDPTKVAGGPRTCTECHEQHTSIVDKLVKRSIGTTTGISGSVQNKVCFGCHELNTSGYPNATRDASGFPTRATYPGGVTYRTVTTGVHDGSLHNTGTAVYPGSSYLGGRCLNCHDSHGTNTPYAMTRARYASGKGAETAASAFDLCFQCHDSDGPAADDVKLPYTAGSGNSGHRITSNTTTATLSQNDELPCYDCHNPHGSNTGNRWLISDERWTNINAGVTTDGVTGWNDQNANAVNDNRDFCFGCHVASNITTWTGTIEGIARNAWKLKLPATAAEHGWVGAQHGKSCQGCHGSPHGPTGGESRGGVPCYSCHKDYLNAMEDQSKTQKGTTEATQTYHHIMGSNTTEGDAVTYPLSGTAKTDVFCLSCHVDHDLFSPIVSAGNKRAANLRLQLGASAPASTADATNSDFVASTGGICLGCHNVSLAKDTTAQLSIVNSLTADPSTWTPTITAADYAQSAHSYDATTYFSDGTVFRANCSKCHSDVSSQNTTQGYEKGSFQFGTHQSSTRHILAQLGSASTTYTDAGAKGPYEEWLCLGCHKGNTAAKDYYGSADMTSPARGVLTVFDKQYGHDIYKYKNLHQTDEESLAARIITSGWTYSRAGWLTAVEATKHVECADCHNVHAVRDSTYGFPGNGTGQNRLRRSAPPTISAANYGVWGVTINGASAAGTWTANATNTPDATTGIRNAAIPAYRWTATAGFEWQLCLKCHSRAAWGSSINTPTIISGDLGAYANSTPTAMTDVGQDFAPSNFAFHPVFRQGRNQPPAAPTDNPDFADPVTWNSSTIRRWIDHSGDAVRQAGEVTNQGLSNSLVDGLVTTSTVTCSDCHNNNNTAVYSSTGVSRGPHGSAKAWMIRGVDLGIKVTTWDGAAVTVRTPNSGRPASMANNFCLNCHRADVYGYGDGSDPATADEGLSRFEHLGGSGSNSCNVYAAVTADAPRKANWVPCYNCHGGRIGPSPYSSGGFQPSQYNRVQSGAIHGTSMAAYDGSNDTGWANNAIVGDPMGYRFVNGASWDAHDLGDTLNTGQGGTNQIGCSTVAAINADSVGGCNNHSGVWGQAGDPTYMYGVGGGTGN